MKYSRKDTVNKLQEALSKPNQLYNCDCINWSGRTSDSEDYYSEVISEYLLNAGIENLRSKIDVINRSNYRVNSHENVVSRNRTNRLEENFAKSLVWFDIEPLGEIIDFQIPLKKTKKDEAGKIDLISYKDDDSSAAYIIELKYKGNKETLLRAALEIFTYHCQLNKKEFLQSFEAYKKLGPEAIRKAILLGKGSYAYDEAKEGLVEKPNLKELIKKMGVSIFLFEYNILSLSL